MNRRQSALASYIIGALALIALALIALAVVIAAAQAKDDADNRAAAEHAQRQAREAAQQSTWAKLDRQGCAMVACDMIAREK